MTGVGIPSSSAFVRMIAGARPPEQRNVPALLEDAARRYPDKPHLTIGERTISFSQCLGRAADAAGQLSAHGIGAGDRVALMCRNRIGFVEFLMGCFWLRAIVLPTNPALRGAQLPLTDTGKVNRSKLKERGLTAATWDREAGAEQQHVHR